MTDHTINSKSIVKILIVGGQSVGKSTIVSRILGTEFHKSYIPTKVYNIHNYEFGPTSDGNRKIELWDVGSDLKNSCYDLFVKISQDVSGVVAVFDKSNKLSFDEIDQWMCLLHTWIPNNIPKLLLAHKADIQKWCVDTKYLDMFVKDGYFIDWFLTVGHPEFGDYDSRRGYGARQRTPTEVINLLLKRIFQPLMLSLAKTV
jgi:small GTP-binding protein